MVTNRSGDFGEELPRRAGGDGETTLAATAAGKRESGSQEPQISGDAARHDYHHDRNSYGNTLAVAFTPDAITEPSGSLTSGGDESVSRTGASSG